MIDTTKIFDQLLGAGGDLAGKAGVPQQTVEQIKTVARDNPLLVGGLAGLLLGRLGGNLGGVGGAAIVGGIAYKAYQDWQARNAGARREARRPLPDQSRCRRPIHPSRIPTPNQRMAPLPRLSIVAMIAAAKADGEIDADERRRIEERLTRSGLNTDELAFVRREMDGPVDIEKIVRAAGSKEAAVELYTISRMAAPPDTAAEQGYLAMLAGRLRLEPELVASIEKTLTGATT